MSEPRIVASVQPAVPAATRWHRVRRRLFGRHNAGVVGIIYVLPTLLLMGFFLIWPITQAVYYSFFNWDGATAVSVGLGNYRSLLNSPVFWEVLKHNLILLLSVPLWVFTPLVVALLLFLELPGWRVFLLILFAPTALSWVVIGIVWHFIFSYHGPINQFLALFNIAGPDWLSNNTTAIAAIIVTAIWANLGTGLIIYLTGLGSISPEIIDAASIDGAGLITLMIRVVLPLMRRYVAFFTTLSVITAFTGLFSLIYVMTNGGPGFGTTTLEYFVYVDAFNNLNFGEASAVGVALFVVIFSISLIQMTLLRTESEEWS